MRRCFVELGEIGITTDTGSPVVLDLGFFSGFLIFWLCVAFYQVVRARNHPRVQKVCSSDGFLFMIL